MKTQIKYNLKEDNFHIVSEIKKDRIKEIVGEVLRAQMGAGSDTRKPVEKNLYTIVIDLELEDDTFKISSDTGNKSLTAGILMQLLKEYGNKNSNKIIYE